MADIKDKFKHFPQCNELREVIEHVSRQQKRFSGEADAYAYQNEDQQFDFLVENQRGMKFFGIPLFSNRSLIPMVDPSTYQLLKGNGVTLSYNNMKNYPLPDLGWEWSWDEWYVLMANDVDDQGWIYSSIIFNSNHWKGKYRFGNFVRRRVWMRMRNRTTS